MTSSEVQKLTSSPPSASPICKIRIFFKLTLYFTDLCWSMQVLAKSLIPWATSDEISWKIGTWRVIKKWPKLSSVSLLLTFRNLPDFFFLFMRACGVFWDTRWFKNPHNFIITHSAIKPMLWIKGAFTFGKCTKHGLIAESGNVNSTRFTSHACPI